MKKNILLVAIATMTCATVAGCSTNSSEPNVVPQAPETSVEAVSTQGAEATKPDTNPTDNAESTFSVSDRLAQKFNVKLEDNQYIITDREQEAIVLTAPDGFKFQTRYSPNDAYLVNGDYSESYTIYDCASTLKKETLSQMKDVEDLGDGYYIQKKDSIKAFCLKDDRKVTIVYTNADKNNVDTAKMMDTVKALVDGAKVYQAPTDAATAK